MRRPDDLYGFLTASCFADNLETAADIDAVHVLDDSRRRRYQSRQARPKQTLIVCDHNTRAKRHLRRRHLL